MTIEIKLKDGKHKVYHINMLKEYFTREPQNDDFSHPFVTCSVAAVLEEDNDAESTIKDEDILVHYNVKQKESYLNVKYSENLSENKLKQLKALVCEFQDIFSDVPTVTNLGEHKIQLSCDRPVRCRPYPVPLHLEESLNKELDSMLASGIIEPSQAYYASPLVLVKKPDGSLRLCVNYKMVNNLALFDPEPILSTDDILDKLGGSKFYSKFDLCKGYYQVPLEEKSKDYSTFVCKRGLFRFKVMPFGLASAGASFTRIMRRLLENTEHLDSYLDDVLCHTSNWEDHLYSLRQFFSRVRVANIRLKPTKCELGGNSVSFLGHKVIEDHRSPDNLNKILEATRPQTKKEVMSFIGLVGFFSSYIPRYAAICVPLTDLLRKG